MLKPRPHYLQQLIAHRDKDLVKIVTGLRRCGKSSLLQLFHDYLLENGVRPERVVHLNLESLENADLTDYVSFYQSVSKRLSKTETTYLLFDEIQAVRDWQKAIESFRIDYPVDIYLTGSNAYILSAELATLLSGRHVQIKMLPLSFKEFLDFYEFPTDADLTSKLLHYLRQGGLPILADYGLDAPGIPGVVEGVYSTVVMRDVMQRGQVGDPALLQKVMRFACSNIGSVTSPNRIGNVLSTAGETGGGGGKVAGKTVEKYLQLLTDAYVLYPASRYDVKGRELLRTLNKYYLVDTGFRTLLLGQDSADRGHLLENVVYLELLRRGYTVYVGKVGSYEVDFVAEKSDERLYIQVSQSILDETTRERELRALRSIPDNHPKLILTLDATLDDNYDGIAAANLPRWLLG